MLLKFPNRQVIILLSDKPLPERGKYLYMENDKIQLFEDRKIRTAWDAEQEEWYFSIVDVVAVLTDSPNPQTYWHVLKKRLKDEGNETVTNCNGLKMTAADGKKRMTMSQRWNSFCVSFSQSPHQKQNLLRYG